MQEELKSTYDLHDSNIISVIDDLPLWSAPFGLKLLNVVQLRKNINVLDIGSGMGFPIVELSQRLGNTCKVFGIDPWKEAVDRIKLKIETWGIENINIIEGKAESLPFEDNYFDLIVSNNGINNVDDELRVFKEISRVSTKGAQLVITLNLPETMKEFYDVFRNILLKNNKLQEIDNLKKHIFTKRKPLAYTRNIITQIGFEINNVYEDYFKLRYSDGSTMLNHFLIQLAFINSWKEILDVQDVEPIFNLIENELNKLSGLKGELTLTVPWVCFDCKKM